jgi:hypothetical protein
MQYIWICMQTAYEAFIGIILWLFAFTIVGMIITGLTYSLSGEWRRNYKTQKNNLKPKYEGKPILVNGGKDET